MLKENGQLDKARYSGYVFSVLVESDGSLHLMDKNVPETTVFLEFIKQEKKWYTGVLSRKPIPSLLKLKVPKELFEGVDRKKLIIQKDLAIQHTLKTEQE